MALLQSRRALLAGLSALPLCASGRLAEAAANQGLLARIRAQNSVTVGLANSPPYSGLQPGGELTGVAPAVTKAVLARLGVTRIKGVVATYGQLIPGLLAGRWDFIDAALTITKERCEQVLFADPIVFDGPSFFYMKSLRDPPKTVADLIARGFLVGVDSGGAIAHLSVTRGVKPSQMQQFPDDVTLIDALLAKRIQVIFQDKASVTYAARQRGLDLAFTFPIADAPEHGSSCVFRKTDLDLYEAFQRELRAMKASGEYLKIASSYGFDTTPTEMAITAKEACLRA